MVLPTLQIYLDELKNLNMIRINFATSLETNDDEERKRAQHHLDLNCLLVMFMDSTMD